MKLPAQMNEQYAYAAAERNIEMVYATNNGSDLVMDYMERSGVNSLCILTVDSYRDALAEIERLWPRIKDKTVVEIGAGVGMLAVQMAKFAKRVYAIESDPAWAWVFTDALYAIKPPNLTYIFGRAQEMVGILKADVAVIYTNSDVGGMAKLASEFAPVVIRGPLVPFGDRMLADPEDIALAQRVAARIGIQNFGVRGFTQRDLDAAIAAEIEAAK
jgi:predicted RNA methylase